MLIVGKVHCGDEDFKKVFTSRLEAEAIKMQINESTQIVIDRPLGWAFINNEVSYNRAVVLSDNCCPSYQLDLLERGPGALIGLEDYCTLAIAIRAVQAGHMLHPKLKTPLTLVERQTLRLVALGHTNKEVAKIRNVAERTVKNSLTDIYRKLDLQNRVCIAHYYFGNWHLLKNWTPLCI